jgi:CRP-like cAMP-binding protein
VLRISTMIAEEMPLTEAQAALVDALIPIQSFAKGEVLLKEGQVARHCYFTLEGCVRAYRLVEGQERTTAFYTEGDPVAPLASYTRRVPADHFLVCLEDAVLAVLERDAEARLYREFPAMEALCRVSMEDAFGKQQAQLADFVTKSPEARYRDLLDRKPDLVKRVPQYVLASYLGIQPESLSRIRKRIAASD